MGTAHLGRTHGCTDHRCDVKIVLANSEPSTHGMERIHVDGRLRASVVPPPEPNTSAAPSSSCAFHDVTRVDVELRRQLSQSSIALDRRKRNFRLEAGVWFRRGRLVMVSPDSLATACPLSGRNSTYRLVQILKASSAFLAFRPIAFERSPSVLFLRPPTIFFHRCCRDADRGGGRGKEAL